MSTSFDYTHEILRRMRFRADVEEVPKEGQHAVLLELFQPEGLPH